MRGFTRRARLSWAKLIHSVYEGDLRRKPSRGHRPVTPRPKTPQLRKGNSYSARPEITMLSSPNPSDAVTARLSAFYLEHDVTSLVSPHGTSRHHHAGHLCRGFSRLERYLHPHILPSPDSEGAVLRQTASNLLSPLLLYLEEEASKPRVLC